MLAGWDWAAANPLDLDQADFLALYAELVVLLAMVAWLLRDMARTTDRRPDLRDLGEVELAYLFGGAHRAADTLCLALLSRGAAVIGHSGIVVGASVDGLPRQLEDFRAALNGTHRGGAFVGSVRAAPAFAAMLDRLLARKILLAAARRRWLRVATWGPAALLLLFGGIDTLVALSRGAQVEAPLAAMLVVVVAVVATLRNERYVTREASASLAALRDSRSLLLRTPDPEEIAFAFAFLGEAALQGTAFAAYVGRAGIRGGHGGAS